MGNIQKQYLGLERSNSDVIMNYDANKSFNKKYENGYQGENKYLNAGGLKFKAPENQPMKLKHKNIIDQMNNDERRNENNLPQIFEKEHEYDEIPLVSAFNFNDD